MGVPAISDDEEEQEEEEYKILFSEKILLNFYDLFNEIVKRLMPTSLM